MILAVAIAVFRRIATVFPRSAEFPHLGIGRPAEEGGQGSAGIETARASAKEVPALLARWASREVGEDTVDGVEDFIEMGADVLGEEAQHEMAGFLE